MKGYPKLYSVSEKQLELLHQYSVKIIQTVGVRIEDPEVRAMLCEYGCREEGERVFFSPELVAEMIKSLKQEVTFTCATTGEKLKVELGGTYSHSTGGIPWIVDHKTGEKRNPTEKDLIEALHVMNQLPNLDIPCALVYPSDYEPEITQLKQTALMLKHCKKPIYTPGISAPSNVKYIVELFKLFGGEDVAHNPIGMTAVAADSPLCLAKNITDCTRMLVEAGIPTALHAAPMAGLTGPLSVAGTVAQSHAEVLAFACVAYLFNPECVLIHGARPFFVNMKSAQNLLGLPETGIGSSLASQLACHIGMMTDVYGIACTSCASDAQLGYEKMINGLLPALGGGTIITGFGSTASLMSCSLNQLVIDDEIMAMIKKANKPLEAEDEEELGYEALCDVIENDETFMEQEHTIEHIRSEIFTQSIGFDSVWAEWERQGTPDLVERAGKRAEELLAKDEPVEIDPELLKKVDELLERAKAELL